MTPSDHNVTTDQRIFAEPLTLPDQLRSMRQSVDAQTDPTLLCLDIID